MKARLGDDGYELAVHQLKCKTGAVWAYELPRGIEVHFALDGAKQSLVLIPRAWIMAYARRAQRAKKRARS
jgi:hypothetical protein